MRTRNVVRILSPAKVNLFLEVLGKRTAGYHEIETVIQEVNPPDRPPDRRAGRAGLADQLEIKEKRQGSVRVKTDSPILPVNKSNLVYQAATLLKRHCRIRQGVEIIIRKRIPVGGGLGGGSSNAAYTLKGLNRLWRLGLSNIELSLLAAQLGSDVPFFIYGGTALCKGRGEIVFPLPPLGEKRKGNHYPFTYLVVYPGITIPTRKIYRNLNLNLTKYPRDVSVFINKLFRPNGPYGLGKILFNRLETTILKLYPVIGAIRTKLTRLGLSPVLIAGSGSSLFGPVGTRKEAEGLASQIRAKGLGEVWQTQPRGTMEGVC